LTLYTQQASQQMMNNQHIPLKKTCVISPYFRPNSLHSFLEAHYNHLNDANNAFAHVQ